MTKEKTKIYIKTCEVCGKEITSLVESQCEYNFENHIRKHTGGKK